jgi:hypothetical protein
MPSSGAAAYCVGTKGESHTRARNADQTEAYLIPIHVMLPECRQPNDGAAPDFTAINRDLKSAAAYVNLGAVLNDQTSSPRSRRIAEQSVQHLNLRRRATILDWSG